MKISDANSVKRSTQGSEVVNIKSVLFTSDVSFCWATIGGIPDKHFSLAPGLKSKLTVFVEMKLTHWKKYQAFPGNTGRLYYNGNHQG